MHGLASVTSRIDRLSAGVGRAVSWLALVMVLVGAYNALARYLERFVPVGLSSNAYIEAQWYLFSLLFLLGAADALRQDAHVRVDVLHGRLGQRARDWIDLVGTLVFLLPTCAAAILLSWPSVRNSFAVREVSPDPGGLPRWPIKAVILAAFLLLGLQGVAEACKRVVRLRGAPPSEPPDAVQDEAPEAPSDDERPDHAPPPGKAPRAPSPGGAT